MDGFVISVELPEHPKRLVVVNNCAEAMQARYIALYRVFGPFEKSKVEEVVKANTKVVGQVSHTCNADDFTHHWTESDPAEALAKILLMNHPDGKW